MVTDIRGIEDIVKLCMAFDVKNVVISPGSRNAPLSITFDRYKNEINCVTISDERSAAFFAIGMIQATNKPAAVVCTSGSALLNYFPAVSEAWYRKLPLIILSADRPAQWINQCDGQTIMQTNVFGTHVKKSVSLPVVMSRDEAWLNNRLVNEALISATTLPLGPVHINIPLNEPLYGLKEASTSLPRKIMSINKTKFSEDDLLAVVPIINESKKVMMLAGQAQYNEEISNSLARIKRLNQFVILCETTSNLHLANTVNTIDRCVDGLNEMEENEFAPEVLITIGDAVVSKKIKGFLRRNKPKYHVYIGSEHQITDTYQLLTHWLNVPAFEVLPLLEKKINSNQSSYNEFWKNHYNYCESRHHEFLKECTWSDLKVFSILFEKLPWCNLHLGNSTPIRYAQLFNELKNVYSYSNRGTSGIDGSMSTAAGHAYLNKDINILITGDISFYYDSNALWNKHLKSNFKIVLINNSGGNIFRIIEGAKDENLTKNYFEAHQEMNAFYICKQFDIRYFSANNEASLKNEIEFWLNEKERPSLLEIHTNNIESPKQLKKYFEFLKAK